LRTTSTASATTTNTKQAYETMTMQNEDNLFTRLSVTKSLTRAFDVLQHRIRFFLMIGLLEAIPFAVLMGIMFAAMGRLTGAGTTYDPYSSSSSSSSSSSGGYPYPPIYDASNLPTGALIALLLLVPVWSALLMIGTGATIRGTAEIYAGQEPQLLPCLNEGFRRACTLFLFGCILFGDIVGVSLVFGIVFGIFSVIGGKGLHVFVTVISISVYIFVYFYVLIAFQMTPPSIVLERKSAVDAMQRSWELVHGNRCYVFCTIFLLMLVGMVIGLFSNLLGPVGSLVIHVAWMIIATPLGTILGTVLFFSLRVEREGLNKTMLLQELGVDGEHLLAESNHNNNKGGLVYKPVEIHEDPEVSGTEVV
jgi:hypothetical protein